MAHAEPVQQRFLDFLKQKPQQSSPIPATWPPPGEASSALSKSSSSVVMPSDGKLRRDAHPAHSSSDPCESSTEGGPALKEHDYIGLAEVSSTSSSVNENDGASDVEDTDLRLGLGPRKDEHFTQRRPPPLELELLEPKERAVVMTTTVAVHCYHHASASGITSAGGVPPSKNGLKKRAFGEALVETNMASAATFRQTQGSSRLPEHQQNIFLSSWPAPKSNAVFSSAAEANARLNQLERYDSGVDNAPPAKGQVVGWPPIRSYRKNTLSYAYTQPTLDREGHSANYVKVNMDGIPIGRKVDLNIYHSYESLQKALEEMFYSPSNGNCTHFLSSGVFLLTYEDKEGDRRLVGHVPWGMFTNTVRRLRIVRGADATGLAPRR